MSSERWLYKKALQIVEEHRVLSASMRSRKKIYPLKTGRDPA